MVSANNMPSLGVVPDYELTLDKSKANRLRLPLSSFVLEREVTSSDIIDCLDIGWK